MHGNLLQIRYTNFCGDHKNEKKIYAVVVRNLKEVMKNLKKVRK
jgi:hypothetical protein